MNRSIRMLLPLVLALPVQALAQDAASLEAAEEQLPPSPMIPAKLDDDGKAVVAGVNAFSIDLYRQLVSRDENLFVSPASASVAVGFAYRGASGTTAQELRKAMRFPFEPEQNLRASGAVLETMNFSAPGRELVTANAVWAQTGMPLDPGFERDMTTHAKAALQRTDFRFAPGKALARINGWVSDVTHAMIPNLLSELDVTKDTRTVLVNAIYFKAKWDVPFSKTATRPEPFTAIDGTRVKTQLMHHTDQFQVLKRGGVRAIRLPYAGREVSMAAFLPDDADGLPAFESGLDADKLAEWLAALDQAEWRETILTLPKFKMRNHRSLKPAIVALGSPAAFTDQADLSKTASLPYPGGAPDESGLKIDNIIQEAAVEVDESGSEAAAATAVTEVIVTALRPTPPPPPPFVFRADKPFLFLLRDNRTGQILFLGRYVKPEPGAGAAAEGPTAAP